MSFQDLIDLASKLAVPITALFGYFIKNEIAKVRSALELNNVKSDNKLNILDERLKNHIENDEEFNDRVSKSLARIEYSQK